MTWHSSLQLSFDSVSKSQSHTLHKSQKTRLFHRLHTGALMVQRPLYPEPEPLEQTDARSSLPIYSSSKPNQSELKKTQLKETELKEAEHSESEHKIDEANAIRLKSQAGICHVYVLYPPAGIADGDSLTLDFDLRVDSHAVITTPGAGKWYGQRQSLRSPSTNTVIQPVKHQIRKPLGESAKGSQTVLTNNRSIGSQSINSPETAIPAKAEQHITAKLEDNAILEWLPQESIYFDHSVSHACNRFYLAPTASLMTWDIAVFGRQAYDETFANGQYNNRLEIWRNEALLVSENTQQQADSRWFHSPLGLNSQHVHGSFWAVPSKDVITAVNQTNPIKLGQYLDDTVAQLRQLIDQLNLPIECTHNYQAINCRYLGLDVRACFEAFYQSRELLREKWYQLEPHRPRIWDT